MKREELKQRLTIFGTCFLSSSFSIVLFEMVLWAITANTNVIVAVAALFSVVSIVLSTATAIFVLSKMLSSHSVQVLDLKSRTLAQPVSRTTTRKDLDSSDPLFPKDEDDPEIQAERKAAEISARLFGGPVEKIDDSIM